MKTHNTSVTGGCLCGGVRYKINGRAWALSRCHCSICRRASGAAVVDWASFQASEFAYTQGTPACYTSSAMAQREFCPTCGSQLVFRYSEAQEPLVDVTIATFDDPAPFAPTQHIWADDALPWVNTRDGLTRSTVDGASHAEALKSIKG